MGGARGWGDGSAEARKGEDVYGCEEEEKEERGAEETSAG